MLRALCFAVALAPACLAQLPLTDLLEERLRGELAAIERKHPGVLGVTAIDLTSGRLVGYHADYVFAQASVIKIPILIRAFEAAAAGELALDSRLTLTASDAVGGSGELQKRLATGAVELTVLELLTAMIQSSDNTATNRAIALVGMNRVNAMLNRLRLPETRLRRVMMDSAAARRGEENISTPAEMARLAVMIYREEVVSPAACRQMIGILKLVKGAMKPDVPAGVEVASKTGGLPGVHAETGIIYLPGRPFVLSVMSGWQGEANPVGEVTRAVYEHFDRLAASNRYGHKVQ
jgi:beta-lactamase class A